MDRTHPILSYWTNQAGLRLPVLYRGQHRRTVLERAAQKLRLDQLVIQQGQTQQAKTAANKDELMKMITHDAEKTINSTNGSSAPLPTNIDTVVQHGEERTIEPNSKYERLNLEGLNDFKSGRVGAAVGGRSLPRWEKRSRLESLVVIKVRTQGQLPITQWMIASRTTGLLKLDKTPKMPRAPKQIVVPDFLFFPEELSVLRERELPAHKVR
ncbi:hypothetical protein GALMADRAFT_145550 [Galerina marginata CBS 339.88]|uniref:ISWI HAND domain-containing protein n=1 Tax=Galerina marginata (strain CBS 339.88) TaxID=685588 RepID=A0A067SF16_GALM3|nr:hypothetical protein GALMADRAFT_145550 [Galerina marginata CBS 339.88]